MPRASRLHDRRPDRAATAGCRRDRDLAQRWRGRPGFDCRPQALGKFTLGALPGYAELDAEALYMEYTNIGGRLLFYVGYGAAGVAIIDWSDPTLPTLVAHAPTIHEANAVTLQNGRLYVADSDGGIAILK